MTKPRNFLVVLAIKRKAGAHKKSWKQLRRKLNKLAYS